MADREMMTACRALFRLLRMLLPSMRSIRVIAYATFVFGALALVAARSVHADVREVALGIGHQLSKLEDLTGNAYLLRLNGAEVHRASTYSSQSVKEVLDRYEAYCAESASAIAQAMLDIPEALERQMALPKGSPLRRGIVREEDERRGMVVCFAEEGTRVDGLRERLRAFVESGDLSEFGHFRYAFVEKNESGNTHVVTLWSDGPLNVGQMFPAEGDAPGSDSAMVPRPAASRRTLSASVDGFQAAVRIYEVACSRAEVVRTYDEALSSRGFSKVAGTRGDALAYVRGDGAEVFLSLTESEWRTTVTVVEAGQSSVRNVHVAIGRP